MRMTTSTRGLLLAVLLGAAPAGAGCGMDAADRPQAPPASRPAGDDIAGVVTGPKGPEAGVWVIAETTDLPTRYAKIVVTDDRGRYLVPDLPAAEYDVWVRGYGLVDSPKRRARPGATIDLKAVPAPHALYGVRRGRYASGWASGGAAAPLPATRFADPGAARATGPRCARRGSAARPTTC